MTEEQQHEEPQGIGLREAVRQAYGVMGDLYENTPLTDLLLEEVERSGRYWLVTMGFRRPGMGTPLGAVLAPPGRAYKRLRINAETGEFEGMEIRQLPAPPADRLT